MTDVMIISQMIKESAKVPVACIDRKTYVKLTEPQAPDSSVTISGIPPEAVVIKIDKFLSPDSIFVGSKDECKRADYVIIADSGKKKRIIHIEMKRDRGSDRSIVAQLAGSFCFIRYCQEIGISFWQEKNFLKDFQHRFISFRHTSIRKRRTRIERQGGVHDKPEKMMKIDWPNHLEFNHLAGV